MADDIYDDGATYGPTGAEHHHLPDSVAPGQAASLRDHATGRPLTRDDLEAFLRTRMAATAGEHLPLLEAGEAEAVAALLDELAARHPGESLGRLARELVDRLYDRMGL
ncbi:hypothetical protein ABT120_61435 [Nonomuraea angiospora]|uniref:hypothetical protein n=1 Tax=Nonomuraea angiospora TaxID=46172 RepID=UPI00331E4AF7